MQLTDIEVDPRPVAIVRIALAAALLMNAIESFSLLHGIARGKLAMPVLSWIPAPTGPATVTYLVLGAIAAVMLAVGWQASAAALLSGALGVVALLWDQQTYSSHLLLATLLVCWLVPARADQCWAVGRRSGNVPWWPQLLMMTQLSVCYIFAALSKINPDFLDGRALQSWVRFSLPDPVFPIVAVVVIGIELFLGYGLWWPPTRRVAATLGACLHVAIIVSLTGQTLGLVAFALTCVPVYLLFLTRPGFVRS